MATGTQTVSLKSDANGQIALYINPENPNSSAVATAQSFWMLASSPTSTFDANTGVLPSTISYNGPLSNTAVSMYECVAFAITVIPVASINNSQGTVQMSYFQNLPNTNASITWISQAQLTNSQFYQSGNLLGTYRGIRLN